MAAQLQIPGLQQFSPHGDPSQVAQKWLKWKKSFQYFITAAGVVEDERKKALLLHLVGTQSQEVYDTLNVQVAEEGNYEIALKAFDDHFEVKKNTAYERSVFHTAMQKENESIEQYVTRLRRLTEYCEYGETVDEQIRDQVVSSCISSKLRKRLLIEENLTLDKVRSIAKSQENSISLATKMESTSIKKEATVNKVSYSKEAKSSTYVNRYKDQRKENPKQDCSRCGAKGHLGHECMRTRGKTCSKCGKTGHFGVVCKSQTGVWQQRNKNTSKQDQKGKVEHKKYKLNEIVEKKPYAESFYVQEAPRSYSYSELYGATLDEDKNEAENFQDVYMFQVGKDNEQSKYDVEVENTRVTVLIDSGSSMNIMDEETYRSINHKGALQYSNTKIYAYQAKTPLKVKGKFEAIVTSQKEATMAMFQVIHGKATTILSKDTSEKLNLLRVGPPEVNQLNNKSKANKSVQPTQKPKKNIEIKQDIPESTRKVINKYPDLFVGVGCFKKFAVKLLIDESVTPVQQPIRRIPFHTREKVSLEIKRLLDLDIIERVMGPTPWINPIVPVSKSTGQIRLCIDMRRANEAIIRERHIIPKIEDILTELHGACYFTKVDLREAYHQIMLDEASRYITAFGCHDGLFQFKRLFFGCKTAFEIFQRIVEMAIAGCDGTKNISDDILMWAIKYSTLDNRTDKVFGRLHTNGFKINLDKCIFGAKEVVFSGHVLSEKGISLMQDKVAAINNIGTPKNTTEVKSFLGMVSYCHQFIQNYSTISTPLRKLTRKGEPFIWTEQQQQAFQNLKDALKNADTMAFYNPTADTRLTVDASPSGLGAILAQWQQEDCKYKPIYYGSRALTDVESRYSQTEREALAVVWACEYFHFYIFDHQVTILTDHKPLVSLLSVKSSPPARIERWILRLQAYNYTIEYIAGNKNAADCLSRNAQSTESSYEQAAEYHVSTIVNDAIPKTFNKEEISEATLKDETLSEVKLALVNNRWSKRQNTWPFYQVRDQLAVKDKILLKNNCIVIPQALREDVLKVAHRGHQGIAKTMSLLREKVWWPGMRSQVEWEIKKCHACQINTKKMSKCEPLEMTPCPSSPFNMLAVDIKGPLATGDHLLVIVDYYSRYPFVFVLKNTTETSEIIKCFEKLFTMFGYPHLIITDNGSQFTSAELSMYMNNNNILHRRTSPYWPSANGEVERFNRTLKKMINCFTAEGKEWSVWLNSFLLDYRSSVHRATGYSPADVLFRFKIKNNIPQMMQDPKAKEDINKRVEKNDAKYKAEIKNYADESRRSKEVKIQPGDDVIIKNQRKKLSSGPFYENEVYKVVTVYDRSVKVISSKGKIFVRNKAHIKKYYRKREETTPKEREDTSVMEPVRSNKLLIPLQPDNINGNIDVNEQNQGDMQEVNIGEYNNQDRRHDIQNARHNEIGRRPIREHRAPIRYSDYIMHTVTQKDE